MWLPHPDHVGLLHLRQVVLLHILFLDYLVRLTLLDQILLDYAVGAPAAAKSVNPTVAL
jgi:hypothetical protein